MTIGYVLDDTLDSSDGVQQAMISIAEKVRSLGHDVHYIVPYTERTDLSNVHCIAKVFSLKFNGNSVRTPLWTNKKHLEELFKKIDFDVLHVQMPYSPIMAGKVIKLAPSKTKIIGTFHILPYGFFAKVGTKFLGYLLKTTNKKVYKSYAVSKPALEFMSSAFGLKGEVLGNPVNYDFFNTYSKNIKNKTAKRIVFVGRFDKRKGVKQLAKIYKKLKKEVDIELVMCGKGPLFEEIKEFSRINKLDIKMPGFVTDEQKAEYLSTADIAIFPSTSGESFGIVLIEAMSAGAGVVLGGDNPGYESVLKQWPDSLFNPNNPKEFYDVLKKFINDFELRNNIGNSQNLEVKKYDINKIVNELLDKAYI